MFLECSYIFDIFQPNVLIKLLLQNKSVLPLCGPRKIDLGPLDVKKAGEFQGVQNASLFVYSRMVEKVKGRKYIEKVFFF